MSKTTTENPGRGAWFQSQQEGSRAVLGVALCWPAWLGRLWQGSQPAPRSTRNYLTAVNEALVPDIKFCGRKMSRLLTQPANALPGVLRRAGTPTPSVTKPFRAFMLGTGDNAQSQPAPEMGPGGTVSPQSPICDPQHPHSRAGVAQCPSWSLLPELASSLQRGQEGEGSGVFGLSSLELGSFDFPPHAAGPRQEQLCAGCAKAVGSARGMLATAGSTGAPRHASKKKRGPRGHSRDGGDTVGPQPPGAARAAGGCGAAWGHVLPAGCILRDAAGARRERRTAEGAAGQEERGHGRNIAGDTGGDQLPSRGGGLGLPWARMQPRGTEGSSIPGCRGSDATPHRETPADGADICPPPGPRWLPQGGLQPKK